MCCMMFRGMSQGTWAWLGLTSNCKAKPAQVGAAVSLAVSLAASSYSQVRRADSMPWHGVDVLGASSGGSISGGIRWMTASEIHNSNRTDRVRLWPRVCASERVGKKSNNTTHRGRKKKKTKRCTNETAREGGTRMQIPLAR
ncbi:hypothetical protein V8C26DRAFT_384861 [Trichoderma gracile]